MDDDDDDDDVSEMLWVLPSGSDRVGINQSGWEVGVWR